MQQEEKKLSLDEIHAELLEQLRDITAVCKKHNISYNMMCGSLLGAVRHKGFIPWDDDVDLLMTREEFQKFREIYPKECDKRFELTYLDTWTPRVMNRDPEKAADYDASLTDERTVYISNKARSMTFFICVFVQVAASMLAILVFDQVLVGQVLCGLTCLQGLLYTVFYWHYDKVY